MPVSPSHPALTAQPLFFPNLSGYNERKIQENVECEIMQVVRTEAHESYREDIIWDLTSNTLAEMEDNVERIVAFFEERA